MGLFDKMKNLFTEEVDEPIKEEVKKVETRHIETPPPVRQTPPTRVEQTPVIQPKPVEPVKEEIPTKEDKFVFFTDDDFKDLEKPKKEEPRKILKREDKSKAYKGTLNPKPEEKKEFKPSPIISPVYGVLNKNYEKSDIKPMRSKPTVYSKSTVTIDDVRNKAYGTVEDEIKDDILGKTFIEQTKEEVVEPNIDIFEELDKYSLNDNKEEVQEEIEEIGTSDVVSRSTSNVDEIFGKLDTKKDEIIEELDEKKDKILDEIDTKKNMVELVPDEEEPKTSKNDVELAKELLDDDETLELAQELEEQKKKLEKINNMMDENQKITKTKDKKEKENEEEVKSTDDLEESELFELIDSTYEKKDDE